MNTLLALDPGATTGYCLATARDKLYLAPDEGRLSLAQMYFMLEKFTSLDSEASLIYEDFQYRNYARMNLDLTPVKIIGIIELFAERYEPLLMVTKQTAAAAKAFYVDDELKRLGVYKKGRKHGRDATRHLLRWLNFGPGGRYNFGRLPMQLVEVDWLLDEFYGGTRLV